MRAVAISGRSGSRHGGFAQPRGQVVVESHTPPQGYPRARGGVSLGCPCRGRGHDHSHGDPVRGGHAPGVQARHARTGGCDDTEPRRGTVRLAKSHAGCGAADDDQQFPRRRHARPRVSLPVPRGGGGCVPRARPRRRRHVHRRDWRVLRSGRAALLSHGRAARRHGHGPDELHLMSDAAVAAGVRSRWRGGWRRRRHRGRSRGSGRVVPLPGAGGDDGVTPAGRRRRGRHARARHRSRYDFLRAGRHPLPLRRRRAADGAVAVFRLGCVRIHGARRGRRRTGDGRRR